MIHAWHCRHHYLLTRLAHFGSLPGSKSQCVSHFVAEIVVLDIRSGSRPGGPRVAGRPGRSTRVSARVLDTPRSLTGLPVYSMSNASTFTQANYDAYAESAAVLPNGGGVVMAGLLSYSTVILAGEQ